MTNWSFYFLLLSISVVFAGAYNEFIDSRGQCWRCYPDRPCVRCPNFQNSLWPLGWSDMCYEPNCNVPENRKFMFPSRESDRYFKCVEDKDHWTSQTINCPCGMLFNIKAQKCVGINSWSPYCVELVTPVTVRSCGSGRRVPIKDYNGEEETTIWEPAPPPTTTLAPPTTTRAPDNCKCVIWWPCWCNPCWTMPCHSCNGCSG